MTSSSSKISGSIAYFGSYLSLAAGNVSECGPSEPRPEGGSYILCGSGTIITEKFKSYKRTYQIDGKDILLDSFNYDPARMDNAAPLRRIKVAVLTYDVTSNEDFNHMTGWDLELKRYASEDVVKVLIGAARSKQEQEKVDFNRGKEWAEELGFSYFAVMKPPTQFEIDSLNQKIAEFVLTLWKNEKVPLLREPAKTEKSQAVQKPWSISAFWKIELNLTPLQLLVLAVATFYLGVLLQKKMLS